MSAPSCYSSPAVTLFAKKTAKSPCQPSASTRRRSEENRGSVIAANRPAGVPARRTSILSPAPPRKGRAPCIPLRRGLHAASCNLPAPLSRCLPEENSKQPAKALPPSITAIYPVCHAACKKTASAPPARTKARKARRLGINYTPSCRHLSAQPPCLQKSSKAGVPPLLPEGNRFADKNHPPWDGLKICQFAFLHKGRSLPRSTLCSSLPPLHKKFAWHGEALVPPGNG